MSDEDIAALSLVKPRGNVINVDTLKTAGTVPETTLTVAQEYTQYVKGNIFDSRLCKDRNSSMKIKPTGCIIP